MSNSTNAFLINTSLVATTNSIFNILRVEITSKKVNITNVIVN